MRAVYCTAFAVIASCLARGDVAAMRFDDPFFTGKLRTHFLWSMVFRPRPLPGPGVGDPTCPPGRLC